MSELFKDNLQTESFTTLLTLLRGDEKTARVRLLGTTDPKPFHGKPKRKSCNGLKPESKESDGKEKRVCKCLYYSQNLHNCDRLGREKCDYLARGLRRRVHLKSEYTVEDYEIPPYDHITDIGNVDLILKGGDGALYATEVKPPEGNPENLLRMVAEIVTYTLCGFQYNGETTRRAIAFFEGTPQSDEYEEYAEPPKSHPEFWTLLKEAEITVFRFEEVKEVEETKEEKVYKICKLYDPKS